MKYIYFGKNLGKLLVSQLVSEHCVPDTIPFGLPNFFKETTGRTFKPTQTTQYRPLELPNRKTLVVSGQGYVDSTIDDQNFMVFIDKELAAKGLNKSDLENFIDQVAKISVMGIKQFLITGGTAKERESQCQSILEIMSLARKSDFIYKQYPDPDGKELGLVITDTTVDGIEGTQLVEMFDINSIRAKAKYNPWSVKTYDLNTAQPSQCAQNSAAVDRQDAVATRRPGP